MDFIIHLPIPLRIFIAHLSKDMKEIFKNVKHTFLPRG